MLSKTKLTLAATFVGVVAMTAAAFGQAAPNPGDEKSQDDRRAAASARDGDGCGRKSTGRRVGRVVHSESKVRLQEGFALVTVDHGTVTAVDADADKITIKRADGETVTATAVEDTKVCKDGKKATFEAIKVGDLARLVSVRSERFTGLRRVVVRTPGSEPAAPERQKERPVPEGSSDQKSS